MSGWVPGAGGWPPSTPADEDDVVAAVDLIDDTTFGVGKAVRVQARHAVPGRLPGDVRPLAWRVRRETVGELDTGGVQVVDHEASSVAQRWPGVALLVDAHQQQ